MDNITQGIAYIIQSMGGGYLETNSKDNVGKKKATPSEVAVNKLAQKQMPAKSTELLLDRATILSLHKPAEDDHLALELQEKATLLEETKSELKESQFLLAKQTLETEEKTTLLESALQDIAALKKATAAEAGIQDAAIAKGQEYAALNALLQQENEELHSTHEALKQQLEEQGSHFEKNMALARDKTLDIQKEAVHAEKEAQELSLKNDTLIRENKALSEQNAQLKKTNRELQEALDEAETFVRDSAYPTSASDTSSDTKEVYSSDSENDTDALQEAQAELSIYKEMFSALALNIEEFQASSGQDIQGFMKALAHLTKKAPS